MGESIMYCTNFNVPRKGTEAKNGIILSSTRSRDECFQPFSEMNRTIILYNNTFDDIVDGVLFNASLCWNDNKEKTTLFINPTTSQFYRTAYLFIGRGKSLPKIHFQKAIYDIYSESRVNSEKIYFGILKEHSLIETETEYLLCENNKIEEMDPLEGRKLLRLTV
jgi:hypothetical protein